MNYSLSLHYQAHQVTDSGAKKTQSCRLYVERMKSIRTIKRLFSEYSRINKLSCKQCEEIERKIEHRILNMEDPHFIKFNLQVDSNPQAAMRKFL